jgi:ribulose kinase
LIGKVAAGEAPANPAERPSRCAPGSGVVSARGAETRRPARSRRRHNLEAIAAAGWRPERVVAVGGGASTAFWPQVVSDAADVAQVVPQQTIGAAYGDALLAAIGAGLVPPATDWTIQAGVTEPDAELAAVYDDRYGLYRRLYEDTASVVHRLAASLPIARP